MNAKLLFDKRQGFQGLPYFFLLGGCGKDQAVDHYIGSVDTVTFSGLNDPSCNSKAAFCQRRNSVFIKGKTQHNTAVFFDNRENSFHHFFFTVDGINQRFAVINPAGFFQDLRIRTVYLKRQTDYFLYVSDHLHHYGCFVDTGNPDIDVENICTGLFLGNRL